jgi:endonuclease/exonuclease/phosphatase family metal-dependent hydrolase
MITPLDITMVTRRQILLVLLLLVCAPASARSEPMPCLEPVAGVTWMRWEHEQPTLSRWCQSVGPPVFTSAPVVAAEISRLLILSWNVHVGGGHIEKLVAKIRTHPSAAGTGLVVLLQETFRGGVDVPEVYPGDLRVPSAIRPRRPTPDVVALANKLGMSVAYVPSMRNGSATKIETREDRGNAVLSSEPLTDVRAIELPFGKQRRVSIAATVTPRRAAGAPIRVIVAHFDTNSDRVAQAEALSERIASLSDIPLIVGGDLNSRRGFRDKAVMAVSRLVELESCGTGRTTRWPLRLDLPLFFLIGRVDYIFSTLGPLVSRTCQTLDDAYDSDHLPLLLDVRY